jgi:predicted nuclease with TOPRIM domain
MSLELDSLNREKRTLIEKENKMFEKLMALQEENGAFKGDHSRLREERQRGCDEISELQRTNRALQEKIVQLTANCEMKDELMEECQNARNCFIELESR